MKILCVIDSLGSGGAQRQMVTLACALKLRGHTVEILIYFPEFNFFRSSLERSQIPVHEFKKGRGFSFGLLRKLSSLMREGSFDIVLSFLNNPNIYVELAGLISRGPHLVVSERSSHQNDKSFFGAYLRRLMHIFSTRIITNSQTHAQWLKKYSWIKNKVSYIYNGLDLDLFSSVPLFPETYRDLRLLSIGRVGPEKNVKNLITALHLFHGEYGYVPEVNWVGRRDSSSAGQIYCQQVDELLESYPEVRNQWHWLGEQSDIPKLLRQHHVLIHPSLYEGLPNVICEALATGTPVLASNVCDHPILVRDGVRGFLLDPYNPVDIAEAINKMSLLDSDTWLEFSLDARKYAEANLSVDKMVTAYEKIFCRLVERRINKTVVVN